MRRRGDEVVLSFEYDKSLVATIKGLPQRRFDPSTKEWVLPLHLYMDAAALLEAVGAHVEMDQELRILYDEGQIPRPKKPEVAISRCGEEYVVQFDYDAALVKAARKVPGRTFDPSAKAWFVPIDDEEETLRLLLSSFEDVECAIRLEPKLRALVPS